MQRALASRARASVLSPASAASKFRPSTGLSQQLRFAHKVRYDSMNDDMADHRKPFDTAIGADGHLGAEIRCRCPRFSPHRCRDSRKGRRNNSRSQGPECPDRVQLWRAQDHQGYVQSRNAAGVSHWHRCLRIQLTCHKMVSPSQELST